MASVAELKLEHPMDMDDTPDTPPDNVTEIKKRRGRQPGSTNKSKEQKLDSPVSKSTLQHALYRIFQGLAKFPFKSDASFEEAEFEEAAKDMESLVNKVPPMRLFFNVIAPIVGIFSLVDKIEKLLAGRKHKQNETKSTGV